MSDCSSCGKVAEPSLSIRHRECGHMTHTDCVGAKPNFKLCQVCVSGDIPRKAGGEDVFTTGEPHLQDGIDYINNPGQKTRNGLISASFGLVKSALIKEKKKPPKPTPEEVLRSRAPISEVFSKHKYGMDHMLRDGITIDDFLVNGYTLDDLQKFEYLNGTKPRKCLNCFTNGLGLTANHLRDYPDELPINQFKKLTKIAPEEFCTRLGLEFPEDSGLVCFGDDNWNAMDMVGFGLTMDDLMDDFGMYAVEQYMDLLNGVPARLRSKAEEGLKIDHEKHGKRLINLAQVAEDEELAEMQRIAHEERLIQEEREAIEQEMWEQEEAMRIEEEEREAAYTRQLRKVQTSYPVQREEKEEYIIIEDEFSSSSEYAPKHSPIEEEFSSSDEDYYEPPPPPVRKPKKKFTMPKRQVRSQLQVEQASARDKMHAERKERMNRIGFIG